MTIIESLRTFFMECSFLQDGRLNVDYLGEEPCEYTIDEVPANPVIKKYLDGGIVKQFVFVFASREEYGSNLSDVLRSHDFYEQLSEWICEQNRNKRFPILGEKRTVQKIEITSNGYIMHTAPNSARYQVQGRLIYFEKGGK